MQLPTVVIPSKYRLEYTKLQALRVTGRIYALVYVALDSRALGNSASSIELLGQQARKVLDSLISQDVTAFKTQKSETVRFSVNFIKELILPTPDFDVFENEGFWASLGTPENEAHHIFPQLSRALFEDPIVHIIEQDFVLLLVMV